MQSGGHAEFIEASAIPFDKLRVTKFYLIKEISNNFKISQLKYVSLAAESKDFTGYGSTPLTMTLQYVKHLHEI